MVFVDSEGNGWPRRLEDKNTFNVITFQLLACNGIKNGRLNAEEGSRGAGLGIDSTREQWNDNRPSFRLPASVHRSASVDLTENVQLAGRYPQPRTPSYRHVPCTNSTPLS